MEDLLLKYDLKGINTGSTSSLINLDTCRENGIKRKFGAIDSG